MKKVLFILALVSMCIAKAAALEVTPGALEAAIADKPVPDRLELSGEIDNRDFPALAALGKQVEWLDLSRLGICGFGFPPFLFQDAGLRFLALPETIGEIPEGFLASSAVETVVAGKLLKSIGDYAFLGCIRLMELQGSGNVERIGKGSFMDTPSLSAADFSGCRLAGREAFRKSGIEHLSVRKLSEAGDYAFSEMPCLRRIDLNRQVRLGEGALAGCRQLAEIHDLPADIPPLLCVFDGELLLSSATRSTDRIGDYAFAESGGEWLPLSATLEEVGEGAFAWNGRIKEIDASALGTKVPDVPQSAFEGVDCPSINLNVEKGTEELWQSHTVWGLFRINRDDNAVHDPGADSSRIEITATPGWIHIGREYPVSDCSSVAVNVWSLGGAKLFTGLCGTSLDISTAGFPAIAVVEAGGKSKLLRLTQ